MSDCCEEYSERLGVWEHKYSRVLSSVLEGDFKPNKVEKLRSKAYSIQEDILSTIDELTAYAGKIDAYIDRLDTAIDDLERRT